MLLERFIIVIIFRVLKTTFPKIIENCENCDNITVKR